METTTFNWISAITSVIGAIVAIWQAWDARKSKKVSLMIENKKILRELLDNIQNLGENIKSLDVVQNGQCVVDMEKLTSYLSTKGIDQQMRRKALEINQGLHTENLVPGAPEYSIDVAYENMFRMDKKNKLEEWKKECTDFVEQIKKQLNQAEKVI